MTYEKREVGRCGVHPSLPAHGFLDAVRVVLELEEGGTVLAATGKTFLGDPHSDVARIAPLYELGHTSSLRQQGLRLEEWRRECWGVKHEPEAVQVARACSR
ncbi:hypothetical protein EDB84DRAFT_1437435 [Lactarius hengduanensis]|nr:hypothetical protein EDB84DRAFT_1437435 [Lactarius hengduanensis]